MYKTIFLAGIGALTLVFSTSFSIAEEGTGVSYAKKKQGTVHFVDNDKEQPQAEDAAGSAEAPADIEPAAGAEPEEEAKPEESRAAGMIKLPRK